MTSLPIAVEIADRVLAAHEERRSIDPEVVANELAAAHPDAGVSYQEVFETVLQEAEAVGVDTTI